MCEETMRNMWSCVFPFYNVHNCHGNLGFLSWNIIEKSLKFFEACLWEPCLFREPLFAEALRWTIYSILVYLNSLKFISFHVTLSYFMLCVLYTWIGRVDGYHLLQIQVNVAFFSSYSYVKCLCYPNHQSHKDQWRLKIEMPSYQCRISHYQGKMVSRLPYLYHFKE